MATVIIGGGLFGLTLGFHLRRRGEPARILEAQQRPGGVLASVEEHGFLTESAANAFLDREPALTRLIEALGLTEKVRPAEASSRVRYVFSRGALRKLPTSPPGFFGSDLLPFGAKLRVMLEPFSRRPKQQEDESLASFMTRHVGERATRVLADAFQTGIYAGDVDKLSAPAVFPKLVAAEREKGSLVRGMIAQRKASPPHGSGKMCGFEGGMATLPSTLARALGTDLELGRRVASLERESTGWALTLEGGEIVRTERVVLTSPAFAAAGLVRPFAPELAAELDQIDYAPIAVVHLGFPRGSVALPDSLGFLVPGEEKRTILGALFISKIFPWKASGGELVTCLTGGARSPDLVRLGDEELVGRVLGDLRAAIGEIPMPSYSRVVRWERAIPQYNVGHLERMARIDAHVARLPGLVLAGTGYRGVGLTEVAKNAEAVAESLSA